MLEAYRMFAYDRGWVHKLEEAVMTGLTAEAAVERVQSDTRARMLRQTDPFLRERLHDLDDLANRLMRQLTGRDHAPIARQLPENAIVVARSMGPAALLDYDRKRLRGLVLEEGGPTFACRDRRPRPRHSRGWRRRERHRHRRSGRRHHCRRRQPGSLHIRPLPDMEAAYIERVRLRARRQHQYLSLRDKPCVTKDGAEINCCSSMPGLRVDLPHIVETGAARHRPVPHRIAVHGGGEVSPRQRAVGALSRRAGRCGRRPVTFRTLDIGGDKVLPYMRNVEEENPALGWRAIRLGPRPPGAAAQQLRALLRAAAGRELRVMFPMIATVKEFEDAKELVERELTYLRRHGHKLPERVEVGTMVEVPSLLYQLDELLGTGRFPLGRLQRSGAVPLCGRPRQSACVRALRCAVRSRCCGR